MATLKTLGLLLWVVGYVIGVTPTYLKARRLQKQGRLAEMQQVVDRTVVRWARRVLRAIKMDVNITGAEHLPPRSEPVLFVANHQSFLDIVVMLSDLNGPHGFMAKDSLYKVPLLGGWIDLIGCVAVEREDMRAAAAAMRQVEELIESGKSLIIFPEGTRSKSDDMAEFKAGAVRIAARTGVPIIPVALGGVYRGLEGNGYRVQPTRVHMDILPPVDTKSLSRAEQKALAGRLHDTIEAAKNQRHALPPG